MSDTIFTISFILALVAPVFIIKAFHISGFFKKTFSYIAFAFVIFIIGGIIATESMTDAEIAKLHADTAHQDSIQAINDSIDWYQSTENKGLVKYVAEDYVKNHMNNPDSYENVELEITKENGDHYIVYVKFRGTNAFGGIVTNSSWVEVISNHKTESCRAIGFVTSLDKLLED